MNLTRHLGMFRIDRENLSNPVSRKVEVSFTQKYVLACWDMKDSKIYLENLDSQRVWCVPQRICGITQVMSMAQ